MSGAVERWSAPSGSLSRVVDLVHGTAKWVITVDEEVVLAADYDTALAQRDRARDIAARLGLMVAEVERILSRQSHTIGCPRGNRPSAECWCGLDDLRAAIDGYSDDDSAPDPQHPAYKALHRDAEVGT